MIKRKTLTRGNGFRIVDSRYSPYGAFLFKTGTVVVRPPSLRSKTFRYSLVATEGIQGQPQLTFDSYDAAKNWLDSHADEFPINYPHMHVGNIRGSYDCVLVPLADGSEGWLSKTMLPDEGSEEWDELVRLYPRYFSSTPIYHSSLFHETLSEAYTGISPEDIKKTVFAYVQTNGYIRGTWNGRWGTESPTVVELHRILRAPDRDDFLPSPEQLPMWERFKEWADTLSVDETNVARDWLRRCLDSWRKEANLGKEDVKNLVSFVSYYLSNEAYQQRQRDRQERQNRHEAEVQSETNTWAGEIGDTVTFTVRKCTEVYGQYGSFWNAVGTDGRRYVVNSRMIDELKPGDRVTGVIKSCNEFRGLKQTKLRVTDFKKGGMIHSTLFDPSK